MTNFDVATLSETMPNIFPDGLVFGIAAHLLRKTKPATALQTAARLAAQLAREPYARTKVVGEIARDAHNMLAAAARCRRALDKGNAAAVKSSIIATQKIAAAYGANVLTPLLAGEFVIGLVFASGAFAATDCGGFKLA